LAVPDAKTGGGRVAFSTNLLIALALRLTLKSHSAAFDAYFRAIWTLALRGLRNALV
jgi:hypothetical protein